MSYKANVLSVMTLKPADAAKESDIIREVLYKWNETHSKESGIVLLPVGCDAQECDIMAAAFWTRVGGKNELSADKILEHADSGKPALLFFSEMPVAGGCVDAKQYKAFGRFKQNCKAEGIYESYDSIDELKEKFLDKLEQAVSEQGAEEKFEEPEKVNEKTEISNAEKKEIKKTVDKKTDRKETKDKAVNDERVIFVDEFVEEIQEIEEPDAELPKLSEDAVDLLKEIGKDEKFTVVRKRLIGSTTIKTNGRNFVTKNVTGEIIKWEAAIRELEYKGLLEDKKHNGETYVLNEEGKRVAELV